MAARTVQLSNRLVAIVVRVARADVAELVDAHGSGPCGGNPVEVRVLSSAPKARAPSRNPNWALHPAFDRDALLVRGVRERGVVGLVLVGVGDGEALERTVERVVVADVAGDLGGVAAARMGVGERGAAELAVARQACPGHALDHR